jgi:hypothetical protein
LGSKGGTKTAGAPKKQIEGSLNFYRAEERWAPPHFSIEGVWCFTKVHGYCITNTAYDNLGLRSYFSNKNI